MNKLIQELAEQAFAPINDMASEGIADRSTFNTHWFRLYNQKFAELIVRECDRYVAEQYDELEPWMQPGDLLKHLGVEE